MDIKDELLASLDQPDEEPSTEEPRDGRPPVCQICGKPLEVAEVLGIPVQYHTECMADMVL